MTTAVDSAVLIDVFQEEPQWAARSADALDAASRAGRMTVCEVVWAEVAGRFASPAAAAAALSTLGIEFDPMAALAASDAAPRYFDQALESLTSVPPRNGSRLCMVFVAFSARFRTRCRGRKRRISAGASVDGVS